VKEPFTHLVGELISELSEIYPNMTITPKDAIFRLNRDVRFSKDKTPYKIHMAALISPGGKKDKTTPAMYLQANHLDLRVYSGSHMLEKDQLYGVRKQIASNLKEFEKLISDKKFVETFGEIHGEQNKRLDPEFQKVQEKQPLVANKGFYYFFKLPPKSMTQEGLINEIITKYKVALPLNNFLIKGLKLG
jgi:uncharacterized protein (TIGR02453 family)